MHQSVLQREPRLTEIIDPVGFQEVCESFASHFRVGLRVLDERGRKVVDLKGPREMCDLIHGTAGGKAACTVTVEEIKRADVTGEAQRIDCFSGCRYLVLPVIYDDRRLGRLVFGPYVPDASAPPNAPLEGLADEDLLGARGSVSALDDEAAASVAELFGKVIDAVVFSGYKALLTSSMHIESTAEFYGQLEKKNRDLAEANERLKELDRLKSNFLATVSHELKTPLTSIIGYSEMLNEGLAGEVNDEQQNYLGTIMDKGEDLLQLIASILDMSKIEAGTMQLAVTELAVGEMVQSAVESVGPQARKKQIAVTSRVADGLPPVKGDPDKLRQVLINLLANAVKFTPDEGRIGLIVDLFAELREEPADEGSLIFGGSESLWLRLTVFDSGIGIPAENLDRVFKSFYQVDGSTTRGYGGAGLGLAIARSFVEAHGGQILIKSRVNQGSQFTVLLPLEPPEGAAAAIFDLDGEGESG